MRSTWRVAESDEFEEVDSSSMGGVSGRSGRSAGEPPVGVIERDDSAVEEQVDGASTRIAGGGTRRRVTVDVLPLEDLRRTLEVGGERELEHEPRGVT